MPCHAGCILFLFSASTGSLAAANLASRNGLDPGGEQVDGNGDDTDDPEGLGVVDALVTEDDGKDDATKVTGGAGHAGDDTVGSGVNVGDEGEAGTVAGLEEEGHTGDEAEHGGLGVGVGQADGNLEATADDAEEVEPDLLGPDVAGGTVQNVRDDTAERTEDDVEETKHGSPATGTGLAESLEVLEVVGAENGVDGKLSTEGAHVDGGDDNGLGADGDHEGVLEGGLLDNLAVGSVEEFLVAELGVVADGLVLHLGSVGLLGGGLGGCRLVARLLLDAGGGGGRGKAAALHVGLDSLLALRPLAGGAVVAEDEHADGDGNDQDEGDDKGDAPGDVGSQLLVGDERVKDGRHDKVGDAATGVAPAGGQGVGGTDDVLVKEGGGPDLAGDKGTAEDTDEEAQGNEAIGGGDGTGEDGGDGTEEEAAGKGDLGTKVVAGRAGDDSDDEAAMESVREPFSGFIFPVASLPSQSVD